MVIISLIPTHLIDRRLNRINMSPMSFGKLIIHIVVLLVVIEVFYIIPSGLFEVVTLPLA